ncbi:MAG: hypothetical protein CM15mV126_410 [uncultured marine virus]|nr:MAG: hypothetical protein CM15mV126_410 [uncultured marine virus]
MGKYLDISLRLDGNGKVVVKLLHQMKRLMTIWTIDQNF